MESKRVFFVVQFDNHFPNPTLGRKKPMKIYENIMPWKSNNGQHFLVRLVVAR